MKNIYLWLYERYAVPKLKDLNKARTEITATFAERVGLSQTNRLRLDDLTGNMRLRWGAEVFALGVRFGLRMNAPRTQPKDCSWLTYFLPQLDDPVS